jgi:hypothetical protein
MGEKGGTSCTQSKDCEKFGHKNAIKMKIDDPTRFFSQPQVHPQKNLKVTVHLRVRDQKRGRSKNQGWINECIE